MTGAISDNGNISQYSPPIINFGPAGQLLTGELAD